MSLRPVAILALLLFAVFPGAAQKDIPEFDPGKDTPWVDETGDTLSWALAGCPESRADIVAGVERLESQLAAKGVKPHLDRVRGLEPDPGALQGFREAGSGTLLVQAILSSADVDVVVGCVPGDVFQNITNRHGKENTIGITFFSATYDDRDGEWQRAGAVVVLPEGLRIATEGCHDPQPIGHDLRQATVMHEMLHAIGLGTAHARDGVFVGDMAARNESCSAWWVPDSMDVDQQTFKRVEKIWGKRPGDSVATMLGNSMTQHAGWWIGVPAVVALGALVVLLMPRMREANAARNKLPESGIVRPDGTVSKTPSGGVEQSYRASGSEYGGYNADDE